MDREALHVRVKRRLEMMIEAGLVEEVQRLRAQGYDWFLPAMSAVGYAEFQPFLNQHHGQPVEGACPDRAEQPGTLADVIAEVESSLHRFIRHQYNWFALDDPTIQWFDVTQASFEEIEAVVHDWLETC
jgi:tRNA dimethylallyltransferase